MVKGRWRVRRHRVVYQGRLVRLDVDELEYCGRRFTRENLIHPGAVAVVPVLPDGRLLFIRQFRYAAQRELLELPAGTLEPGESAQACARRELEEETGFTARSLRRLGVCYPVPGYSTERIGLFVARGLRPTQQRLEPDEVIRVVRYSPTQVRQLIARRQILDAKSLVGLLYYFWNRLQYS